MKNVVMEFLVVGGTTLENVGKKLLENYLTPKISFEGVAVLRVNSC